MKKFKYLLIGLLLLLSTCYMMGCSTDSVKYDYIEIKNFKEQEEHYSYSFTVKNISNEDITVVVCAYVRTGYPIQSGAKKIIQGGEYTFYCSSGSGDFSDTPNGLVIVRNAIEEVVETISYEFS